MCSSGVKLSSQIQSRYHSKLDETLKIQIVGYFLTAGNLFDDGKSKGFVKHLLKLI